MAWTRVFQTGFEMGRASETPFTNSVSPPLEHSMVNPITGELSFKQGGQGGLGYQFSSEPTIIRMNFLFNTLGGLEDVPPLLVYCREPGGIGFMQWAWRPLNWYTDILYYDQNATIVDRDIVDTTTLKMLHSNAVTCSVGLVMKVGSGGFASMYINGYKAMNFDASASGMEQATSIFAVKLGETNPGLAGLYETHFDDWYIDSGTGAESDSCPPVKRLGIVRPDGAGSATNWNPTTGANHECVSELIGDDDNYNYSETPNDDDRFSFSSFGLPTDSSIDAVIPICRARAGTPSPQLSVRLIAFDGLSSAYSADKELRLGYTYISDRMTTNPAGGAWSESDVNSAEFGYELRA